MGLERPSSVGPVSILDANASILHLRILVSYNSSVPKKCDKGKDGEDNNNKDDNNEDNDNESTATRTTITTTTSTTKATTATTIKTMLATMTMMKTVQGSASMTRERRRLFVLPVPINTMEAQPN